MSFVFCADGSNERGIRITQKAQRIWIQSNMRSVFLAITGDSFEKSLSLLGRLDADTEDLHVSFEISFPFVDKGRDLGAAPGSPAPAIKENHRRRRIGEDSRKFDRRASDIFEGCFGEFVSNS